jgi:hypothetical protein
MKQSRLLTLAAAAYETREETFEGRPHLVVPVVALVQGVLHAMNSATPELVTAEEFTRPGVVGGFDGRPLFHGHPLVNGEPVSGNSPEVIEAKCIGRVFHAAVKNNKLAVEAWIDVEKCEEVAPDLLERIRAGKTIEVSVGVFCESDDSETGEYDGKRYAGAWRDIVPDHLALLVEGDTGACSVEMGCGVRAAKGAEAVEAQKPQKTAGLFARFMSVLRGSQSPDSMSDQDVRRKLGEELRKKDPRAMYPEAVYASAAAPYLVYCVYEGNDMVYFKRDYTMTSDGAVSFGDPSEVEPVLSYEPVGAEVKAAGQKNAAEGAPCSCHKGKTEDTRSAMDMTKEQIAKFLETATDEQVKALSAVVDAPAQVAKEEKVETPAAVAVVETPKVETPAVAAKTPTFEDVIALASAADRDAFNTGKAAGEAKRAETIKALKDTGRNSFTDAELAAKSQSELDSLVKLAGSAKVDFSAAGASREAEGSQAIPAPISMIDAVKAASASKNPAAQKK